MLVEFYKEDIKCIAHVMSLAPIGDIVKKLERGRPSLECDELYVCNLTKHELDRLSGYLCHEANHNKKKLEQENIGRIADYFLSQAEYC